MLTYCRRLSLKSFLICTVVLLVLCYIFIYNQINCIHGIATFSQPPPPPWIISSLESESTIKLPDVISSSSSSDKKNSLVKIIHQSWKSKHLPRAFKIWSESWKTCFPDWKYVLWTDEENRELIRRYYPWFLRQYDALPQMIHRADMMRPIYMHHYGGIYTDLDNECLRPFEHLLLNSSIVFGAMEGYSEYMLDEGYIQNSFMYSQRGHSFWMQFIHDVIDNIYNMNIMSWFNYHAWPGGFTGPTALIRSINKYRSLNQQHNDITVYPPALFNPYSWKNDSVHYTNCNTMGRMNWKQYSACRSHFINISYVVQYHSQSWSQGKSRVSTVLSENSTPLTDKQSGT